MFRQLLYALIYFLAIAGLPDSLSAQEPTTQDCRGAIPVCDFIYVEENTASGYGNYFEIPYGGNGCPNNHCMDGERNSRWYVFTVIQSGDLKFQITPQVGTDDYDWAVFNLTSYHCEDIWGGANLMMSSCNAAGGQGYQGITGISTPQGGTSDCNNGGPTNKWNANLPVYEGETYVLVVSDWTQTPGGYTLDFSTSTASIFDDQKPYIDYIGGDLITECGTNELFFSFNENVKCSSVSAGDFKLDGPGGPYTIDSIYGETCALGGNNEREYTIYFTPGISQGGAYTFEIKNLSFISDACNNYATAEVYDFDVDLDSPEADAGVDQNIAYGGTASLIGSANGGSGNYTYHWEPADLLNDPDVQNPVTVNLTASTEFTLTVTDTQTGCTGEDAMWVNVNGGPLDITIDASSTEICEGDIVNLYSYPNGGSGDYTFTWTSDPPGFESTEQNPSDYPEVTTTYTVEVFDGFTTVTSSITITVNPRPVADAGPDQTINTGTFTTLNGSGSGGSGNFTYHWEPGAYLVQNDIPDPQTIILNDPVLFTLIVEDANGCASDPDNVLINTSGPALTAFPLADPPEICLGDQVYVYANATGGGGDYTYQWSSDPPGFSATSADFTDTPDESIRYDLLLTDQYGNSYSGHINVTVDPLPQIDLIPENIIPSGQDTITVCVRDTVLLDAGQDGDSPGTIYFWDQNYENRYYVSTTNGNWIDVQTHNVFVQNGVTGCENTAHLTIIFDFNECAIGIPENKTDLSAAVDLHPNPNNGKFTVSFNEKLEGLNIDVYDVSGRLVHQETFSDSFVPGDQVQVDAGMLEKGLYLVHLNSENKTSVIRMVIQ